uniref:Putative regulator component n=1 Tax=Streptomyces ribosidificus TaxID=80859 RepID=Q4R0V9_STRRI|nr:putative regulator component [Streptomyces ribosidificus]CAG34722.1 RacB protein [Streptomyces ribosidificus]
MSYRIARLRRRCRPLLGQLALPHPFSIESLCAHVSANRRRPLHLHPLPLQAAVAGACGLWVATETDDHIFYEQRTARPHQEHIVLHEIGHMLFNHHAVTDIATTPTAGTPGGLLGDLSPRLVRRILTRTDYSSHQEQEAEMLATLIRTGETGPDRCPPADPYGKLHAALGVSTDHAL